MSLKGINRFVLSLTNSVSTAILCAFLVICFTGNTYAKRFELIEEQLDNASQTRSLYYLDRESQKVFIKQYDTPPLGGFLQAPRELEVLTEQYSTLRGNAGNGQLVGVESFSLNTSNGQERFRESLERYHSAEQSLSKQEQVINTLRSGSSRFKLLQVAESGQKQVGVYHNSDTGQFILQGVENQSDSKHNFPLTGGAINDLSLDSSTQSSLLFKSFGAETLHQFDRASWEINQQLLRQGFQLPENAFLQAREELRVAQDGFDRVHLGLKNTDEEGEVYEESLYNPVLNQILRRVFRYNEDGSQNVIEEEIIDLNHDVGFARAEELYNSEADGGEAWASVLQTNVECINPLSTIMPVSAPEEELIGQVDLVLGQLWEDQIEAGLPESLTLAPNNSFVMELSLFGEGYSLVGEMNTRAELIDLNFGDVEKARQRKIRIRHIVGDTGAKQFLVEAFNEYSGEWEAQALLEGETYIDSNGDRRGRLAALIKGQETVGEVSFNDFEKSVYNLRFREEGGLFDIGRRIRLNGERANPFSGMVFRREGDGGLMNIAFQLFFSRNGKREKVRDTILEEATRTFNAPEYQGLLSTREIAAVAENVTAITEQRTNGFSRSVNEVQAIATGESYSQYGELVLTKFIQNFLSDEPEENIRRMTDQVMASFRQCLDAAASANSSDRASQCMEVFTREAPVAVGEYVLQRKLEEAGLGDFKDFAAQKFRACIQDNYDGASESTLQAEGMNRVKDCIYRSIVLSLDVGASAVVNERIGAMSQEMGLPLSYSSEQIRASMVGVRSCLEREGLGDFRSGAPRFNAQRLRSMPTDLFEQGLMFCTNSLVRDVTLSVGRVALAANLTAVNGLDSAAKARIAQATLSPGLESCMDRQQTQIQNAREQYRARREELVGQNVREENIVVDVIVPSFDSEECTRIVTNLATGYAAIESIDLLIGSERSLVAQRADNYNPLACFERLHEESMANVTSWTLENHGKSEQELAALKVARDSAMEVRSAGCLNEAITWASYYAAQDIVEQKLSENPEYAGLQLNASLKARIGTKVRECFSRELSSINTVSEVLTRQEELKDVCAADMLKDPMIQRDLFGPYIEQALSSVALDNDLKEGLISTLSANLGARLMQSRTLDEAMAVIDGFKDEAIPIVVEEAIRSKIYEVLSLNMNTPNANADSLAREVSAQVFGANGRGDLGLRLREALTTGDEARVGQVINTIENQAAMAIGPQVIREKGNELLESGEFSTQEEVEDLVRVGSSILTNCLATPLSSLPRGQELLDYCVDYTNLEVTKYVLDKKVTEELRSNPLIGSLVDDQRMERLRSSIMTEELSAAIVAVGEMDDGPEKVAANSRLILNFKFDATQLIFNDVLSDIVGEKLPRPSSLRIGTPEYTAFESQRLNVVNNGLTAFNSCVDPLSARIGQRDNSVSQLDLDECLNMARLKVTEDILPQRLSSIVAAVFPDINLVSELSARGSHLFKTCTDSLQVRSDSNEYGHKIDGCLNQAVLDFVGVVIEELKNTRHGLFGVNSQISWERCQQQIERAGQQLIFDSNIPQNIRSMEGNQLFAELYKAGEELEPIRAPDTDWIEAEIIKCAATAIAPTALMEFREEFLRRHSEALDAPTEALIFDLTTALVRAWRTPARDGSPVQIDFGSLLARDDVAQEESGDNTPVPPFLSLLGSNEEMAIDYLSLIAAYDPESMKQEVESFEARAVALSASATGPIPVESFVDVLAEGQLMETLIESMIAKTVRDETMQALTDEGADTSVVWLLSSKEMIGRLFSTERGRSVISRIKNEYLIPLLKGELSSSEIPENLMNEAKEILIADTDTNGFVETLFGPIAQKGLSDQRAGIETAWFGRRWGAYVIGYDTDSDFVWGDRYDTSRTEQHLRQTPSGREAVSFFAQSVLRPTLMGNLTPEGRNQASEKIEDYLKSAMGENL